ncbi:hypothetical protein [Rariglobus hedericola]|uniref:HlyD family efflux transporter periplasmic adaptor subunit n=1 Tax=Rariglobus hedericola TaxID=2597822 RepID=A0A556QIT3_9BACT|nr:hypothetical protein [Rariglobus hedericola]TSJ76555.1 hypothetical protein FPL22_10510 [Rariglobus hedericola]
MINRPAYLLLSGCLLLTACKPSADPKAPSASAAPAPWRWEIYPESDRLLLATLPGTLEPARSHLFRAPGEARLQITPEILAAAPGTRWPADTVWGRLHTPADTLEDSELDRATAALAERERQVNNADRPAARLQLDREVAAAADNLALARLAEKDPDLFRAANAPLDPRLLPASSVTAATETLKLVQARRAALDDPATPETAELQTLRAEVTRRTRLRDERRTRSELKLPFAASLVFASSATAAERTVAPGELLAVARDWTGLRLRVRATLPELHGVAPASLIATVTPPGGSPLVLTYVSTQLEPRLNIEEPVFYFETTTLPNPLPPAGIDLACTVHTKLAASARIVPKLDLANRDTQATLLGGWAAALPTLLPGAELVAEGRASLALRPAR